MLIREEDVTAQASSVPSGIATTTIVTASTNASMTPLTMCFPWSRDQIDTNITRKVATAKANPICPI
jgi:hypothetical protein